MYQKSAFPLFFEPLIFSELSLHVKVDQASDLRV